LEKKLKKSILKKFKKMSFSYFPQYEHELFWRCYDILYAFLAHCGYCLKKWKILSIVYEGVNHETRSFLEYWNFCAKDVNEACDFLDWLAWDTYEFKTSYSDSYIPPLASVIIPLLCERFIIVLATIVILILMIFLMIVLLNCPV